MKRDIKQIIVVRKDLNMRKGKIAAQVAHASMGFLTENAELSGSLQLRIDLSEDEMQWLFNEHKKIVVGVDSLDELENLILKSRLNNIESYVVKDLGLTEFKEETITCAAFGPTDASYLDKIFGHLKLI